MERYKKGANAERELIHTLFKMGFSVARVAGSGATSLPCPDILALKPEKQLAFECKAWAQSYLTIADAQMQELQQWSKQAGVDFYVAWKVPRKGWIFLKPRHFNKTAKGYCVSQKHALRNGINLGVIAGQQSQIKV